jgi:hypothetical protein
VIKCDKCGYEFPAEVNERILVEHITKYHMREQQQQQDRLKPAVSPQRPLPPVSSVVFFFRETFIFCGALVPEGSTTWW